MSARVDDARKLIVVLLFFLAALVLDALYALGFFRDEQR